jgi:hypothetical protein
MTLNICCFKDDQRVIILVEIIKLFWETIEPFEITLGWNPPEQNVYILC